MAVVFLIGGTGNQLFSYAASHPADNFSQIFLTRLFRQILGWTQHEQVLTYPRPHLIKHIIALMALSIDVLLAILTRKSLFSTLDTRKIKAHPLIFEIARLGYFQQTSERRDVAELGDQFVSTPQPGRVILHVRGGDLLQLERSGQNVYGILDAEYYRAGIATALTDLSRRGQLVEELLVLTDDPEYVDSLNLKVDGAPAPHICNCPLKETFSLAIGSDWFVSSNSTMAYWILRLRRGQRSVAPSPFQKRQDYSLPDETVRIRVDLD